ncbi:phenylalanine--tRNA ligase subunit beta [Rubrivivax gelatinosus]|uniref:Phenylalanine--tRNA ligase beta subunit n=1 Tax=Rubrivivax gelatinosus TaxID=28068 RepID=A0A4R2MAF9_RUBGE|nr:phenylalanine--tRNA ligase subunit beta [Rubrivivax gelatinosus]MBK1686443.1 phenylalanine--tRNA ligase subunit beta [Rubrivivax gelatinosus]TCP04329.1 phenylalanyl-tRNA synthetase beta subunit [Rubrivivax gelatinosus]
MQFPESWLREFCNPPLGTQQLADLLTMSGLEVESLEPVAPPFTGIVVAEILEAEPHPQADRLRVCKVSIGAAEPLQIVCGAPNARAGLKAPLATVGAMLPPGEDGKPFKIGVGKLRGVQSFGMLCSARELKIADEHGGLLELPADAPVGTDIREYLKLDDTVFTLKLTPNLAHALSVHGIAREVSALTGTPLSVPAIEPVVPAHDQRLPVEVQAADLCGRFSGRVVRGVDTKAKTPQWMVDRLARCGQRSVSALVDISNYVMFEFGRPSHIFDLDKIHEKLVVRWGREGETLKLLNGNTISVDARVGVIADAVQVESLAGIMGGDATAVSDDTKNVYVEAAFWWPEAVQGRSRRYNFSTDAGHRFERGVDPALTVEHIERITRLIIEICGGEAGPMDDQTLALPKAQAVTLRVERAAKVTGLPLTQPQCAEVFRRLGLQFSEEPGRLTVTPPSWRFDLKIEEDLIEEVVRVVGYDKLPATPPQAPVTARVRPEARRSASALQRAVAALDYQETINFSFVEERWERELAGNADPIKVLNPIAAPLAVMRSSLIGSLVAVLRGNLARKAARVRVFELGRVFRRDPAAVDGPLAVAGVDQPLRIAGLAYGNALPLQWGQKERAVDFFDLKGDVEALFAPRKPVFVAAEHPALHPGRCARIEVDGRAVGFVGELHPKWRQAYELPQAPLVFELEAAVLLERPLPNFEPLSRQQSVWRDLALVVGEGVRHDALIAALRADALVRQATLFDLYKPAQPGGGLAAGERSLAVRLELLDPAATLTDERIDAAVAAAVERVQAACGARLRT